MGADVASIANHHKMNLLLLSEYSEIWDRICWQSSGNGVTCLCSSSKQLRASTRKTSAFVFLAGRDAEGYVVPWNDRSNIFMPSALFRSWHPDFHFRLRAESFAYVNARHCAVYDAVEQCINHLRYDKKDIEAPPSYAECFGCPSSPICRPCVRALAQLYAADESLTKFSHRCYSPSQCSELRLTRAPALRLPRLSCLRRPRAASSLPRIQPASAGFSPRRAPPHFVLRPPQHRQPKLQLQVPR
jgi:hypothetical protein